MKELEAQNKRLIKEIEELKEINRVSALAHKVSLIESPLYMNMSKHKMLMEGERKSKAILKQEVLSLNKKLKKAQANWGKRKEKHTAYMGGRSFMIPNPPVVEDPELIERIMKEMNTGVMIYTPTPDGSLDNLTTSRLHLALKAVGIKMSVHNVDKIIDLVELIVNKGPEVKMDELTKLQEEWRGDRGILVNGVNYNIK